MDIQMALLNNKRWAFLVLTILLISSSTSSGRKTSRFTKALTDSSNFGADEGKEEVMEGKTRVKRSDNCNSIPNVNKYRTIDGTCNNLGSPLCGASETPFFRYLPRDPPGHNFRCPNCPRPRHVSFAMNNYCSSDHNDGITVMVMQWGQYIDHDLVLTRENQDDNCCEDFQNLTPTSPSCVPIDVTNDPFYSGLSTTVNCLPFVRSTPANPGSSDRQTINELTAYLDGSQVYGSTPTVANNLRTFSGGRLDAGPGSESISCPGSTPDICPRSFLPGANSEFMAGDVRVEEQPSLTSLHTLFVRFHNDIASILQSSCGSDENTYQATRKIVGAIIQQITYNEFLPIVLGNNIMNDPFYGVLDLDGSYSYDSTICASAPNAFATAAFRFGHSLIPNEFHLSSGTIIQLAESFENHGVTLNPSSYPSHFLGGIIVQPAMPMDQMLVDAISNKLFAESPFKFGSDLYARNIQRGRDHGIPGYVKWHNDCVDNDPSLVIRSFSDLYNLMPDCVVEEFIRLYTNVEDIDLFPAGVAEYEVPDGLVGPTFACIIAEHFSDLKFGDRFWFQKNGVFTSNQVMSIRKTLLASLICLYTNVDSLPPKVMLQISAGNERVSCRQILRNGILNDITTSIWSGFC